MDFLAEIYLGNPVKSYLVALCASAAFLIGAYVVRMVMLGKLRRLVLQTRTRVDDLAIAVLKRTRFWVLLLIGLYLGTRALVLPYDAESILRALAVSVLALQVGLWASAAVAFLIDEYRQRKLEEGDTSSVGAMALLGVAARIAAWSVVSLLILDNVGVDVTALVAGLGIGGIAIALAVKDLLQDLLSSVSIVLDKPFEIGDFIVLGDMSGRVEHIGLKSTRLRAASGEQLVVGNDDLLRARIRNMKRMEERRVVMDLHLAYDTPVEKLEALPAVLEEIVERQEHTRFDRAHFLTITNTAFHVQTVFHLTDPSGAVFNETQQRVNLEVLRTLAGQGIALAYPTQTIHVRQ